jgi:integral membrane protein
VTSPLDPSTSSGTGSSAATPSTTVTPAVRAALKRYRVIAYVVGVMLLVLVFVAMPLKYLGDDPSAVNVVGPLHGFLYVVYLLGAFDLARRVRWSLGRMVMVALAGTIPFLSFYAERKVSHELTPSS